MLEVLLRKANAGRLSSFLFIGEEDGKGWLDGIVGRSRGDPHKIIGHLEVMKAKLTAYAASERDFENSTT